MGWVKEKVFPWDKEIGPCHSNNLKNDKICWYESGYLSSKCLELARWKLETMNVLDRGRLAKHYVVTAESKIALCLRKVDGLLVRKTFSTLDDAHELLVVYHHSLLDWYESMQFCWDWYLQRRNPKLEKYQPWLCFSSDLFNLDIRPSKLLGKKKLHEKTFKIKKIPSFQSFWSHNLIFNPKTSFENF